MKIRTLLFCLTAWGLCNGVFAQNPPRKGLQQITETLLKSHTDYLASDALKGRDTPSKELDLAADYIVNQFREAGIQPVNGSYFQTIDFCASDIDVSKCAFGIAQNGVNQSFELKKNFTPLAESATGNATGNIVFAGYGITAPEKGYDDYANINVKGKIVLILKHEPQEKDKNSIFDGDQFTPYSEVSYKIKNAYEHGAAGVILVTDPLHHLAITAQGYLWKSLYLPKRSKPMYEICSSDGNTDKIPAVVIDREVVNHIFGDVDSLKNIQERIDQTLQPQSFEIPNKQANIAVEIDHNRFPSQNIIGWIEGKNPELKNEFVLIGAHYDHIGIASRPNSQNDSIMNGADDNASGTAGVLAIAKAFALGKTKPERSVIFMLFTGEEKGLIGSNYYVNHPLFPLEKTVAMINLDMIGRNGSDTVYVEGAKYNPDLSQIAINSVEKFGLKRFVMQQDLYQASDHYSFFKKGISAIGFTSGLHKDYHTASDNPEDIQPVKMRKIAQLAYHTAYYIANKKIYFTTTHEEE